MQFTTRTLPLAIGSFITLGLAACNSDQNTTIEGIFVDEPVINLPYRVNGGSIQFTSDNPAGGFECENTDTITFGLGDDGAGGFIVPFGSAPCADELSPIDLAGAADSSDPRVQKTAQLLQSLNDGTSTGNLNIPQSAIDAANGLDAAAFAAEITSFTDTSACDDNVTAYMNLADTLAPGLSTGGSIACATAANNLDTALGLNQNADEENAEEGQTGGNTGTLLCPANLTPTPVDFVEGMGLSSQVATLEVTFANAGAPIALGDMTGFIFSGSGFLFIDDVLISEQPYLCAGANNSEIFWLDETNGLVYAASFTLEGAFNEVNLADLDFNFLGQYTDEIGDLADVNVDVPIDPANGVTGQPN